MITNKTLLYIITNKLTFSVEWKTKNGLIFKPQTVGTLMLFLCWMCY